MDPGQADNLWNEHIKHKQIWKDLELTLHVDRESAADGDVQADGGEHGTTAGHGPAWDGDNTTVGNGLESHQHLGEALGDDEHCDQDHGDGWDGGQQAGPELQRRVDDPGVQDLVDARDGGQQAGPVLQRLVDGPGVQDQGDDVRDGAQQAGPGLQRHVDGPGGHGEGEQLPRVIVRRRVRLRDGVKRDGRLQLSIVNFTSEIGRGEKFDKTDGQLEIMEK